MCTITCKQKSSNFVPIFFHNFSSFDCHIIFEELLTQAFQNISNNHISIIPKSKENYVSVQVGCLRFLDSNRFLISSLDKIVKSINTFPVMQQNGRDDEFFKKNWLILMIT